MKRNQLMRSAPALFAMAALAAVLMTAAALAQQIPDLPNFVQKDLAGIRMPNGQPAIQLMVTNNDFKRFKPTHTFEGIQAQVPVVVSEREAQDYVSWTGKRMGVDYQWRCMPTSKNGVIFIVSSGLILGDPIGDASTGPAAPPGMVYVPEGTFLMGADNGDPDELPKHNEAAGPFFIDKYEVSNAEFKQMFPDFQFEPGRELCPAIVTWEQANAYAAKVEKRLPTEAEWEKAARGTDGRLFPWGDLWDPTFVSWDDKTVRGETPARPESAYGCYDMAGSAWEWTSDWYKPYPGNTSPSDSYGEKFKVIRGGGLGSNVAICRTAHRFYLPPNTTGRMPVGFRCVKNFKP